MSDPTYIREDIEKNKIWYMAWLMSEYLNDNAPIGWNRYIPVAELINRRLKVENKI